jgi:hypothetical protein
VCALLYRIRGFNPEVINVGLSAGLHLLSLAAMLFQPKHVITSIMVIAIIL